MLSRLQDEVPPEPFEVIRRVVEGELGQPIEAVFSEFEREPVASASLAQVHRAVLHDGRIAAVKVQYPGIEELVTGDLRNNELFIGLLNRFDKTLDFSFIAEEMSRRSRASSTSWERVATPRRSRRTSRASRTSWCRRSTGSTRRSAC